MLTMVPIATSRPALIMWEALAGDLVISAQVLSGFAATLLHKISPPARPQDVIAILDALEPIRAIAPDREIVNRAVSAHVKYGLHFYDCMIIASAERAGSKRIWPEDRSGGQTYFGIKIQNPFARSP